MPNTQKPKRTRTPKPAPAPEPTGVLNSDGEPAVLAGVAAVIVNDHGRVLFGVRRGPPEHGGGYSAVPGGKMRRGESFAQAVEREVLEETGLVVKALPRSQVSPELFVVNHHAGDVHYVTVFIECRAVGTGKPENREPHKCCGWEWLSLSDLASRLPAAAADAWQRGESHDALCWVPLPQLSYYREHLGLT